MKIKYLKVENIIEIHKEILKETLEDKGLSPDKSLESSIYRIENYITYEGVNNIFQIAALYGISIAKGHCFNNGNKRTALVSMLAFLYINKILVNASNSSIEELMVNIVLGTVEKEKLTTWLEAKSTFIE